MSHNNYVDCEDGNKTLEWKCPSYLIFTWKYCGYGNDKNVCVTKKNAHWHKRLKHKVKIHAVDGYEINEDNVNDEMTMEDIILCHDFINENEEELD